MKAIAVQKETASEQVAYNPEELNKTFQLASEGEESTAASIPGDVTNFKTSSEEGEQLEDVPHVSSIVDLASKEG